MYINTARLWGQQQDTLYEKRLQARIQPPIITFPLIYRFFWCALINLLFIKNFREYEQ